MLELRHGHPPRVAFLLAGGGTVARRLHPRLGQWWAAWRRWVGPQAEGPLRIPWSMVRRIGIDVQIDVDGERTSAVAWEQWVRQQIISRIPGS